MDRNEILRGVLTSRMSAFTCLFHRRMECGVPISVWDSGDVGGYGDSRHDVVEQLFDVVREDTYYVIDRQLGGTFRTASGIACGC